MIEAETLDLLEWRRLGEHLATFTSTKLGAYAARHLPIPDNRETSLTLLTETKEVYALEENLTSGWKFDGIYDFSSALERAEYKGILEGETLLQIATTLAGMRRLRRVIDELEDSPRLKELISQIRTYPELEKEINRCLDDKGKVTERASPKLGEIRQNLKERRDRIYQKLQNIMQQQSGAIQEPVITQRGERFVLPVKAGHKESIRGIVHDSSGSGATLYIEPNSIVELGNQQRQYLRQEKREEERILQALTEEVAEVKEDLELLLAIATKLDLATARSRYSLWLEANPPQFVESNSREPITLRRLRHPLLVWQHHHEQGTPVVPIDVQIDPETRVVAITGPNTGGKTVTLKTVGLAALMAKVGLFIPAKEPVEIPWFEQVLADIGDEQSIEQSLSTFSGHIRRITRIIDALHPSSIDHPEANEDADGETIKLSLVLLDEVGAGTDPAEGSAIAIALLQYLAARVRLTIATTHYGELKALKYQDERFENASVEFDDETLSPTYRLLWGIPGRSNALTIARRLGLDPEILDLAKNKMGGYSEDINQVISGLEKQRREQEEKAREARQLLEQAEKFYQEVSSRAKALEAREADLKRSQEQAVNEAVSEARQEIAQVIKQLQQGQKTGQAAQKATATVNEIAGRHRPQPETPKPKPQYQPQVGEQVRLPKFNQTGEVLTAPNAEGKLTIRFGLMKMTVSLADIESLDGKKPELPQKQQKASTSTPKKSASEAPTVRTESNTLDIRGYRVAQAESQLENTIRSQNRGALWVIHGKGTGKLRQGVQEFLKQHPQVERYETAPQNEGGSGVTVAYLKS
ncbi:MutS2 family protein [Halothece sp. PCC 7418]|uniref:endonuclease MutS2 n=1 Tax=Halothece sp. (strain PCC 7418) TaxID=65093 RepID=UPI0002A07615|nr:endonuclease MutS2 [Halothece sp. PCC 7418]AFZ43933.1 MutS2 family protein [Halothece sp. PCC 7418]